VISGRQDADQLLDLAVAVLNIAVRHTAGAWPPPPISTLHSRSLARTLLASALSDAYDRAGAEGAVTDLIGLRKGAGH
jgi:hypothetical protein